MYNIRNNIETIKYKDRYFYIQKFYIQRTKKIIFQR